MTKSTTANDSIKSYREGYNSLFKIVTILWVVIFVLVVGLVYVFTNIEARDRFFSINNQGAYTQMVGLEDPNLNNQAILSWASQAVVDIMTFGFNDIDQRFSQTMKNFTPEGWAGFRESVINREIIKKIQDRRQILTAIPSSTPELVYYGLTEGKLGWVVRVPTIVTVRAGDSKTSSPLDVMLRIVRQPTTENPRGIGIDLWVSG